MRRAAPAATFICGGLSGIKARDRPNDNDVPGHQWDCAMDQILIPMAGGIVVLWGFAHIVPTREVIRSMGPMEPTNRRIVAMEWVAEGMALMFIGALALVAWAMAPAGLMLATVVLTLCAAMLAIMAAWTAIVGFATKVLPIRLCPFVLTAAAALILIGTFG
jgi:hypothetical protein